MLMGSTRGGVIVSQCDQIPKKGGNVILTENLDILRKSKAALTQRFGGSNLFVASSMTTFNSTNGFDFVIAIIFIQMSTSSCSLHLPSIYVITIFLPLSLPLPLQRNIFPHLTA